MKTVEELAGEVFMCAVDMRYSLEDLAAILRTDREAVLRRVEETFDKMLDEKMGYLSYKVAAGRQLGMALYKVKKEVCG